MFGVDLDLYVPRLDAIRGAVGLCIFYSLICDHPRDSVPLY